MHRSRARSLPALIAACLALGAAHLAGANHAVSAETAALKIGLVDFQRVLSFSEAGKRSRKILLASRDQKENELKQRGESLQKEVDALKNNILLTADAKENKQRELMGKERQLRQEFQAAEKALQREQIKASESIYDQLKTVVDLVAKEQGYDFVLEKQTAQAILFTRAEMKDLTDIVIERYNSLGK